MAPPANLKTPRNPGKAFVVLRAGMQKGNVALVNAEELFTVKAKETLRETRNDS